MRRTTDLPARRRWVVGGASLVLAATMVGCGSDDDGGGDTQAAETSASEEAADPAAFCEASVDVEAGFFSMGPQDPSTPPEEQQAALEEFARTMEPLLAEAEETAPEEIADDVTTATGIVRQALSGDPAALEGQEYMDADNAIDEYMLAECGYEQLEATGVNYEYEGLPETLGAGTVAVTFTNEGEELHEIGMARINDDVTLPVEQVLALPEQELFGSIQFTGAAFAAPGESDTVFLRLEPGRYGVACFIPQGTTHETEGTGPPHFTLGMFAEMTVQ
jgi:uncharacterized cupredoxin-like copper-binding protein